jgi:hypothetical protein
MGKYKSGTRQEAKREDNSNDNKNNNNFNKINFNMKNSTSSSVTLKKSIQKEENIPICLNGRKIGNSEDH